jgi:putative glycosyltransferase (TIGR04348 family)
VLVEIVTPAVRRSRGGNRVTALRWAGLLRELGHRVRVRERWSGPGADLLVALHAEKSADAIERCSAASPRTPIVLALTGTDVYGSDAISAQALRSIQLARFVVVLQPLAAERLPESCRARVRTIFQSAPACPGLAKRRDAFVACVVGHLRPIKDPFLAASAARLVPADSRLRVAQIGAALDDSMRARALAEASDNPRYEWLGERSRRDTLREIAASHVLVVTSRSEGGANVIAEALGARTPVLSTRIDGSLGMLGHDYPGWFPVGDAAALAELLARCERERDAMERLERACDSLRPRFERARERTAWADVLRELGTDACR